MSARRTRWPIVAVALVGLTVAGGFLVRSQWAKIVGWFEAERADGGALAELANAQLTAPPAGADWPQWRGPNRDGRAAGPINADWAAKPPTVVWRTPGGGGYASVSVADGCVYAFDFDPAAKAERLRCLDAGTGTQVWELADPTDYRPLKAGYAGGPRAAPTIHDGLAYTVGATGQFRCVQLPVGNEPAKHLWSHDLPTMFRATPPAWGYASAPLIDGDLVIVQPGGRDGSVAAFDRTTGEKRWAAGKNPNGYSSPVVATLGGVRQVVAVTGDAVLGLSLDGKQLWSHPWLTQHNANIATPIVAGDYVFVGSDYGKGCTLLRVDAGGVKEVYFRKGRVMAAHISTPVERDGFLFGFDGHNQQCELRCVNLRTGEPVAGWEALDDKAQPIPHGSLVLVGDKLLGQTQMGTLFLADADPAAFRLRGWLPDVLKGNDCWAAPAVAAGRAYLRDAGQVVCVDLR